MRLSLAMIVRDEAEPLARCLASVRGLVDEAIVVDTGSTDESIAVAESHGARIGRRPWDGDFSAARNEALAMCTGDWVLQLDADEELGPGWHDAVGQLVNDYPDVSCWLLRVLNLKDGAPPTAHHVSRLFRRLPGVRYQGRVHETVDVSLAAARCQFRSTNVTITHHGYASDVIRRRKARRNLKIHEHELRSGEWPQNLWYYLYTATVQLGELERATACLDLALGDLARTGAAQRAELLVRKYQALRSRLPQEAEYFLRLSLELAPNQVSGRVFLAQELAQRGRLDEAIAQLDLALPVVTGDVASQASGDVAIDAPTLQRWQGELRSRSASIPSDPAITGDLETASTGV